MGQTLNLRKASFSDLELMGQIRHHTIMAQPETFWTKEEKLSAAEFWPKMDVHQEFDLHELYVHNDTAFVGWKESYLAYLFVSPTLQSAGLGGKLIKFAEDNIRKNHDHVWLWSHPYSEKFYEKNGFVKQQETEDAFATKPLYKFLKRFDSI